MSQRQVLMLVVSRFDIDPHLIPPLKIIIPMLNNLYPVRVFTSIDQNQIKQATKNSTVYEELVRKLESSNSCCLTKTLIQIIKQGDSKKLNYRVCLLGHERAEWSVIMEFKRRGIVVDTVCSSMEKNQMLVQISYITNGVHKIVKENTMIKNFQGELGMNSKMRSNFKTEKKQTVQFSLKCCICSIDLTNTFLACSVCLGVYCPKHENIKQCKQCQYLLD